MGSSARLGAMHTALRGHVSSVTIGGVEDFGVPLMPTQSRGHGTHRNKLVILGQGKLSRGAAVGRRLLSVPPSLLPIGDGVLSRPLPNWHNKTTAVLSALPFDPNANGA